MVENQFATDMRIDRENTIPFFATRKCPIVYVGKFNATDARETDMMSSRWFVIKFEHPISNPEETKPCPKCFAKLVMAGENALG